MSVAHGIGLYRTLGRAGFAHRQLTYVPFIASSEVPGDKEEDGKKIMNCMRRLLDFLLVRGQHTCPWYCCFTFDNVFRRLVQDPYSLLSGLVSPGDTVLDIGPGQGFFTIPLARMAGETGKVVAIDIQAKMLSIIAKKATRYGLQKIISCKLVRNSEFGFDSEANFVLAFWMAHEVPDKMGFLSSIHKALKPRGKLLIAEPKVHVTRQTVDELTSHCNNIGFRTLEQPSVFFSRSILVQK